MPEALVSLVEQGIIEEVVRPLMSGKEAQIYLVECQGVPFVAKIYKDANNRSFKNRAEYTEGRKTRNTRDQRAISKRSVYGRAKLEEGWRDVEADVIYRLFDAGVQVPTPKTYVDNVLVMELVVNRDAEPASRLADLKLQPEQAQEMYDGLIQEVKKMLCTGLVHGDLSEFNILLGAKGPVIIDFPQAVEASNNQNARKLLIRDVGNLRRFFRRFNPGLVGGRYGEELWDLFERGVLSSESVLTGRFKPAKKEVEVSSLLSEILELERENEARREALGLPPSRPARAPRPVTPDREPRAAQNRDRDRPGGGAKRRRRRRGGRGEGQAGGGGEAREARAKSERAAGNSPDSKSGSDREQSPARPREQTGSAGGKEAGARAGGKESGSTRPRSRRRRRRKPRDGSGGGSTGGGGGSSGSGSGGGSGAGKPAGS